MCNIVQACYVIRMCSVFPYALPNGTIIPKLASKMEIDWNHSLDECCIVCVQNGTRSSLKVIVDYCAYYHSVFMVLQCDNCRCLNLEEPQDSFLKGVVRNIKKVLDLINGFNTGIVIIKNVLLQHATERTILFLFFYTRTSGRASTIVKIQNFGYKKRYYYCLILRFI